MNIKVYTGGFAETNAYAIESKDGWLGVDAPQGFLDFLREEKLKVTQLVLTHGHWDHMWDAAAIAKEFNCPVFYHKADEMLCTDPKLMRSFGLPVDLDPVKATKFLDEGDVFEHGEWKFRIFHIPGHCPGSICFYEEKEAKVFGGDVLFAGGVGRWDLPGGSREQLIQGINEKLMKLPDETKIFPGHGPSTAIGRERKSNPFLL